MKALTATLDLPERLTQPDAVAQPTDFNPNLYFNVLRHLSIQSGYQLDWVYFSDELGGKPLVYARPRSQAAFSTYREFLQAHGEDLTGERSYATLPYSEEFMSRVIGDGTPDGYLQLVILAYGADQFHLWWHGLYNDTLILCDQTDLAPTMNGLDAFDLSLPPEVLSSATAIPMEPTVLIATDTVTISLTVFSKWGGFYRDSLTITAAYPYEVLDGQSVPLIEYDCGISF